jgi:hypothetical protein
VDEELLRRDFGVDNPRNEVDWIDCHLRSIGATNNYAKLVQTRSERCQTILDLQQIRITIDQIKEDWLTKARDEVFEDRHLLIGWFVSFGLVIFATIVVILITRAVVQ